MSRWIIVALVVTSWGCDKSRDVTLELINVPDGQDVELKVYDASMVSCAALTPLFDGNFVPARLPVEGLVRGIYPFREDSPLSDLEAGTYTVLAWTNPLQCASTAVGCGEVTLSATATPDPITLMGVGPFGFCTGACGSHPSCGGAGIDAGTCPPGLCCGDDDGTPCDGPGGVEASCFMAECLRVFCGPSDDGEPCARFDSRRGACCDGECIPEEQACAIQPMVCELPFSDGGPDACDYFADLEPTSSGTGVAFAVQLRFYSPDRAGRWSATGEASWNASDGMLLSDVLFTLGLPPSEVQVCDSGFGCPADDILRVALGAMTVTDSDLTSEPVGWGERLYIWASRSANRDEVTELGGFTDNAVVFRLNDDVPARYSVWQREPAGGPSTWSRLHVRSIERLSHCMAPGAGCLNAGPIPAP